MINTNDYHLSVDEKLVTLVVPEGKTDLSCLFHKQHNRLIHAEHALILEGMGDPEQGFISSHLSYIYIVFLTCSLSPIFFNISKS
uniref:Uncharacterized protein n=1 Tax=Cercocebus atys TaxID=9531 RepID=A0A2K5KKX9_CERAT